MFIPGWKDLIKALWVTLLLAAWTVFLRVGAVFSVFTYFFTYQDWLFLGLMAFLVLGLPPIMVASIHHFFFGKRASWLPAWIPTGPSWWEAFWICLAGAMGIILVTFAMLIVMGFVALITDYSFFDVPVEEISENPYVSGGLGIIWFWTVAIILKLQRWSNRPQEKPPAATEGKN
jgi:hypothetical protein